MGTKLRAGYQLNIQWRQRYLPSPPHQGHRCCWPQYPTQCVKRVNWIGCAAGQSLACSTEDWRKNRGVLSLVITFRWIMLNEEKGNFSLLITWKLEVINIFIQFYVNFTYYLTLYVSKKWSWTSIVCLVTRVWARK